MVLAFFAEQPGGRGRGGMDVPARFARMAVLRMGSRGGGGGGILREVSQPAQAASGRADLAHSIDLRIRGVGSAADVGADAVLTDASSAIAGGALAGGGLLGLGQGSCRQKSEEDGRG